MYFVYPLHELPAFGQHVQPSLQSLAQDGAHPLQLHAFGFHDVRRTLVPAGQQLLASGYHLLRAIYVSLQTDAVTLMHDVATAQSYT